MRLIDFVSQYALERAITESSVEQYQIAVNCFSVFLQREAMVDDLTDDQINRFLLSYSKTRSPHTAASKRRSLLVLWRAVSERLPVARPARIRPIKTPPTPRDIWTADEVGMICQALSSLQGRLPVCWIKAADYYVGLVRAAWETGLRLDDLMHLERSQISDQWFCVTMHKTGLPQWCRLHSSTVAVISRTFDEIAVPRRLCWPTWGARTPKACYKLIRRDIMNAAKACGLDASDGPFKKLRRSSITAVDLASPGQGQHHAGHTSPTTTARWYLADCTKLNRPIPAEIQI